MYLIEDGHHLRVHEDEDAGNWSWIKIVCGSESVNTFEIELSSLVERYSGDLTVRRKKSRYSHKVGIFVKNSPNLVYID